MGLDVFEEIVASWLQTKGYFMMNNIKYGNNQEIDILATKSDSQKAIHIEVSCSSNPIGMLGSKSAVDKDFEKCANDFANKKFLNEKTVTKIKELTNHEPSERWFVHANMREKAQLEVLNKSGIKTINIREVISEIEDFPLRDFSGDKRLKQLFDILRQNSLGATINK